MHYSRARSLSLTVRQVRQPERINLYCHHSWLSLSRWQQSMMPLLSASFFTSASFQTRALRNSVDVFIMPTPFMTAFWLLSNSRYQQEHFQ